MQRAASGIHAARNDEYVRGVVASLMLVLDSVCCRNGLLALDPC
ncbi:MAG TPA: hypothetical protein VH063_00290 [Gaiellaceae bacterium]|jgi:hypothetical protein|nr:hypothetical protein [Gaiellaceae bacterium]